MVESGAGVNLGYIPLQGLLFVDGSALSNISRFEIDEDLGRDEDSLKLELASSMLDYFRERGNVLTTEDVLDEIFVNVRRFRNLKRALKKMRKNRQNMGFEGTKYKNGRVCHGGRRKMRKYHQFRNGEQRKFSDSILYAKKGVSVFSGLTSLLREGIDDISFEEVIPEVRVKNYLRRYRGLSSPDRGLISLAVSAGDSGGLLTADGEMIRAYIDSIKRFGLKDCALSNGISRVLQKI